MRSHLAESRRQLRSPYEHGLRTPASACRSARMASPTAAGGRPGYSGAFCHSLASRRDARYRLRASKFRARPRVPPAAPGVEVVYDAEPWTLVDAGCRLVPLGAGKESLNHWDSEGTGL